MAEIILMAAFIYMVTQSIKKNPFKKESIALWLSFFCMITGISLLTSSNVGLLLAILSFLVALLFPKFRSGVVVTIATVLFSGGNRRGFRREFSNGTESSKSFDSGASSDYTQDFGSNYARDFSMGQATGVSDGSPGAMAGADLHDHHHW